MHWATQNRPKDRIWSIFFLSIGASVYAITHSALTFSRMVSLNVAINTKDNAGIRGKQLYDGIIKLKKKFDVIGDVRGGQGLMAAIEVVSDQKKKTAINMDEMKKLHQKTYEAGAMVRLGLNNILMSPPLVISEAEIDQILDALDYGFSSI